MADYFSVTRTMPSLVAAAAAAGGIMGTSATRNMPAAMQRARTYRPSMLLPRTIMNLGTLKEAIFRLFIIDR